MLHVAFDQGDKSLETLVFLHGIAATSRTWENMRYQIDYTKYRVIALDLLGFGKSPAPQGCNYTPEEHIHYINLTLDHLKVKQPFSLIGHSMGSLLSVDYTTRYPDRVKQMILVSPPIYLGDSLKQDSQTRMTTRFYKNVYDFFRSHSEFTIEGAKQVRSLLKLDDGIDVTDQNWRAFRLSLENTIEHQKTYQELVKIRIPITIIIGDLDEFAVKPAIKMVAKLPNVQLKQVPISDHIVSKRMAGVIKQAILEQG